MLNRDSQEFVRTRFQPVPTGSKMSQDVPRCPKMSQVERQNVDGLVSGSDLRHRLRRLRRPRHWVPICPELLKPPKVAMGCLKQMVKYVESCRI